MSALWDSYIKLLDASYSEQNNLTGGYEVLIIIIIIIIIIEGKVRPVTGHEGPKGE